MKYSSLSTSYEYILEHTPSFANILCKLFHLLFHTLGAYIAHSIISRLSFTTRWVLVSSALEPFHSNASNETKHIDSLPERVRAYIYIALQRVRISHCEVVLSCLALFGALRSCRYSRRIVSPKPSQPFIIKRFCIVLCVLLILINLNVLFYGFGSVRT